MKHIIYRGICLCICLLVGINASAYDAEIDGIFYNFSGDEAEVTFQDYQDNCYISDYYDDVAIPKQVSYNGKSYTVTTIGECAFSNCTDLTSITIPSTLNRIKIGAFRNCSSLCKVIVSDIAAWCGIVYDGDDYNGDFPLGLSSHLYSDENTEITEVVIPEGVTRIEARAFRDAKYVTSVTVPNSVTYIGQEAFRGMINLTSINIPQGITSIEPLTLFDCNALPSIVIPEGVTTIKNDAFTYCFSLTSITIPSTLNRVMTGAFYECSSLSKVIVSDIAAWCGIIYDGDNYLGDFPLGHFPHLYSDENTEITEVVIPEGVTRIEARAFRDAKYVTSVTIPNSVNHIGQEAFRGMTSLTSINIPQGVTSIEPLTFFDCQALPSIVIPEGVTTIKNDVFTNCIGLVSITIPPTLNRVMTGSFTNCSSLSKVIVSDIAAWCSIIYDGDNFNGDFPLGHFPHLYSDENTEITEVVIPEGVTRIEARAFRDAQFVSSITIPHSVIYIGQEAFRGMIGLTSINIPHEVTSIEPFTFMGCWALPSVNIPESITKIGDRAFEDCRGLTSVTIPESVTNIGVGAFSRCDGLTSVNFPNSIITIRDYAFDYCTSLTSVNIPNSVTSIGNYAFQGCGALTSLTIGNSVTSIGDMAFEGCSSLTTVTIYAMTPPAIESDIFQGVSERLILYVPAGAISAYQSTAWWKDYTILPISEGVYNFTISLPDGVNAQDYAQMWLELTDTKSGQQIHYVITGRTQYTFPNIASNSTWNVVLRNERGDVFGQIDNVEVKDEDVSVTFTALSKPQKAVLSVRTPEGQDVTGQTQITWTDAQGNYLAQGTSLSGLPVGYQANYSIVLTQDLAMVYDIPLTAEYTLKDGGNNIICQLDSIKQVLLSGKVKDALTGLPLSGAVVSASQTFGGKYSKTLSAKTDKDGKFTMKVAAVPTSLSFAATDYVNQTLDLSNHGLSGLSEFVVPDVSLKSITGATITIGFTYTTVDGEIQDWYSDYQNVGFELFNVTKNCAINQFNVQFPQIVLLEEVEDGDVLRLTASSRTTNYTNSTNVGAFMPVTATTTIAEQKAEVSFCIIELGKIQASFTTTGNAAVVGSLYDVSGKLVNTYNYSNASLTITGLADGNYTLVSMGSSRLFNTIYDLAQLPQTGLAEGTDYVKSTVQVTSGAISKININEVPTLDENKLYYTGDNTSFTVNKPNIVAGNYLTLTGHIDFKPAYATSVSNVQLIVDLPKSCQFVENSVMVGNGLSSYTLNGSCITIPMTNYTDRVLFCVIPTLGGEFAPSAFARFDLNGETVTQPIGSANYTAKDLSISVPSVVARTAVPISGTAIGTCDIDVYDGDVLIGQTTSLANGKWQVTCELDAPYNLSTHNICAKVTTKAGLEFQSETMQCRYDMNTIEVKSVTMINTAHPATSLNPCEYVTVFDFINPKSNLPAYWYWPNYPEFTFLVDLSENDTTKVSDVTLYVHTTDGDSRKLPAVYDGKLNRFVATSSFDMYSLPANVSVNFIPLIKSLADRKSFDDLDNYFDSQRQLLGETTDSINAIENENIAIDSQIAIISSAYQQVVSDGTDGLSAEELTLYLNTLGIESSVSELTPQIPTLTEDERRIFIDNLLNSSAVLLENTSADKYDDSDDSDIIALSHSIIEHIDSIVNIRESLETLKKDTLYFDMDDESWMYYETSYNSVSIESISPSDAINLDLTDNSHIQLYADDYQYVIVDSVKQKAWILKNSGGQPTFARAKRANSADGAIEKLKRFVFDVPNRINDITNTLKLAIGNFQDQIRIIDELIGTYQREIGKCGAEYARLGDELKDIQRELWRLDNITSVEDTYKPNELWNRRIALENRQKELLEKINYKKSRIDYWTKEKNKAGAKKLPLLSFVSTLSDLVNTVKGAWQIVNAAQTGIQDLNNWNNFINNGIFPCENDQSGAQAIREEAIRNRNSIAWQYGGSVGLAMAGTGVSGTMFYLGVTNKAASFVVDALADWVSGWLRNMSSSVLTSTYQNSVSLRSQLINRRAKLKCKNEKDDDDDDGDKDSHHSGNGDVPSVQDPSGFVYEGVPSNRLLGVTATAYYKEMVEDMYGDQHENIVKWDATEYAQENPLFTDEYGMYQWDVPQGLWQVKFEKEGYETTYSDWLPVPPPQLDVNIAMKQARQPEVKDAHAYEDAVEVEFDKYMLPELLTTENIRVIQNGNAVEGTIELLDEETADEPDSGSASTETFASKVRFNVAQPFTAGEVTLVVANRVRSYADVPMQDDYQQTITIEKEVKEIVVDSLMKIPYQGTDTIFIQVLPADAAAGRTLTIKNSSSMILGVETEEVIISENGNAQVMLSGKLPGTAALTFSVEGTDKTAVTIVNVEQIVYTTVATPTANIASGTTVNSGTLLTLTCATEGATIYYTLDGSCPCNEQTRILYTDPIVLPAGTITVNAIAIAEGMDDSEVMSCIYNVRECESIIFANNMWRTYCSAKPLYFTNADGLNAYIASGYSPSEQEVIMTRVEKVPAKTGLLLEGEAGKTYAVPVAETSYMYSNLLVGVLKDTEVESGFVFNRDVFEAINEPYLVKAGEAYLSITAGNVSQLNLRFTDTDGVESVSSSDDTNWHTLLGVRLNVKPNQKGVYINSGRKVLVK